MTDTTTTMELPAALVEALKTVRSVGVVTGAGISAESGVPTYRGKGGVYDDPEKGDRTIEALTGKTLRKDPDLTWNTIADLARAAKDADPNTAHRALVAIEEKVERFVLLTQNVDGLHQRAGSRNVIDIHGNIHATRCLGCGDEALLSKKELLGVTSTPACKRCGDPVRPGVVLFGELLPEDKTERMRDELAGQPPDLMLAIGTTALFPYIAAPMQMAWYLGHLTVEVNPERTQISGYVRFHLQGPAGAWVPALADAIPRSP